jgi:hypothetical protein
MKTFNEFLEEKGFPDIELIPYQMRVVYSEEYKQLVQNDWMNSSKIQLLKKNNTEQRIFQHRNRKSNLKQLKQSKRTERLDTLVKTGQYLPYYLLKAVHGKKYADEAFSLNVVKLFRK